MLLSFHGSHRKPADDMTLEEEDHYHDQKHIYN